VSDAPDDLPSSDADPATSKADGPAGGDRPRAGRMRWAGERAAGRGRPVRGRRERRPGAQDVGSRGRQARGRDRLPVGHDRCAHRAVRRRHSQPTGHAGGLRGAQGRRYRRRRACHRSGGARAGRTAVLRHRRRRIPALLRRRGELRAGLRRPRGRACRGDRALPALDLRHRSHRAQTRHTGLRAFHRGARHRPNAVRRAPTAWQDGVARPFHPRREDGRRRLRHQPTARLRDRRCRAETEAGPGRRRLLP
jgi:hypothetical protein